MSVLDKLWSENRRDITIDGHTYTCERVSLFDCILAGEDIPLPVLAELEDEGEEKPAELDAATRVALLREARRRQDWVVRNTIRAIDGEEVRIPEDVPLSGLFSDDARRQIADFGLWADPEGKG